MNENPTATLYVFAYNGVTAFTHLSVVNEMVRWGNLDHAVIGGDTLISRARSRAAGIFLKEGAGDVMLMVDHNVSWEPGSLSHIARKALEHRAVVGGVCPIGALGKGIGVRLNEGEELEFGADRLIQAVYVSGGFMAIPREVLEAITPTLPWIDEGYTPFFMPMVVDGEYLSEDWALCERAREAGYDVLADMVPNLNHEGAWVVKARKYSAPSSNGYLTRKGVSPHHDRADALTGKGG